MDESLRLRGGGKNTLTAAENVQNFHRADPDLTSAEICEMFADEFEGEATEAFVRTWRNKERHQRKSSSGSQNKTGEDEEQAQQISPRLRCCLWLHAAGSILHRRMRQYHRRAVRAASTEADGGGYEEVCGEEYDESLLRATAGQRRRSFCQGHDGVSGRAESELLAEEFLERERRSESDRISLEHVEGIHLREWGAEDDRWSEEAGRRLFPEVRRRYLQKVIGWDASTIRAASQDEIQVDSDAIVSLLGVLLSLLLPVFAALRFALPPCTGSVS